MRKLGLMPWMLGHAAVTVSLGAILTGAGCTRAANQEPVPPPSASSAAISVASSSTDAGTTTGAATAASAQVYNDTTQSITAKVGERFTINLPANITTPYKWVVASPETIVAVAERHYDDAKCDGCVGRGGTDRLTFEAKQAGSATLVLRYAPLRSKSDPPERELSIAVTVTQ